MRMRNNVQSRRFTTDGSLRKVTSLLHCIFLSISLLLLLLMPSSLMVDASPANDSRSSLWRQRSKHSWFSSVPSRWKPQHHQTNNNSTTSSATFEQQRRRRKQPVPVPVWKRQLPEPLWSRSTLQKILIPTSSLSFFDNNTFVEIYLLGTSHGSPTSCQDVRLLLEHVQPDVIFVELCKERVGMILATNHQNSTTSTKDDDEEQQHRTTTATTPDDPSPNNMSFWQKVLSLRNGQTRMSRVGGMKSVLLNQSLPDTMEDESEFRVAYQCYLQQYRKQQELQQSQQHRPIWFVFGDRPLFLTMRRCWQSLTWWRQLRFVMALVRSSSISFSVNTKELQGRTQHIWGIHVEIGIDEKFRQLFPIFDEIIVKERDAYMACKLHQTCQCFIISEEQKQEQQTRIATY